MKKPKIICFCGSSRFIPEMAVQMWGCEKDGYICLGMNLLPNGYCDKVPDHLAEFEGVADIMDELHLHKIDLSDIVFIYNKGGYIGESTRNEIKYAKKQNKIITYLEPIK